jgi:archaeal flagellar protein FlaJ
MSFYRLLANNFPNLKKDLASAGFTDTPEKYVRDTFQMSMLLSFGITVVSVFFFLKFGSNVLLSVLILFFCMFIFFAFLMRRVNVRKIKREKEIDRDVLFAGRFLLVKINSGKPLINAIADASTSYGVAGKFFKEIIRDIDLGTPLEIALENAYKTTPSKRFRKILFQINNALKIGVDISEPLEATLDEIAQEQLVEIQRYGRKLNGIIMFYMLLAIVVPSLGITLFSIIASMISINMDATMYTVVIFLLIVVQIIFLTVFKSIRPNLNI